ncbi:MAG: glycosyltransferase, partial [Chthoniobacterales bacterium]|nr:glycosyltransferase [Chthoniobacterales bacterium]
TSTGDIITPDRIQQLAGEQIGVQVFDAIRAESNDADPSTSAYAPPISILVCTREHPDVLDRQLQSLAKLDYPAFEVVVIDNAPKSDRTRRVAENYASFARYVLEPRAGLDYARNTGWQNARHEIVSYTDDDAVVDSQWLRAIGKNFADPQVGCVTGLTCPYELESPAQEYFERYGGMQRGFVRRFYRPGTWSNYFPLGSGRFGAGVNMSLRKSTIKALGGFDNALDVGSIARGGGDLDIMARALQHGWGLVYEPEALVWHQHRSTMNALRKQMFDYGFGFCAYVAKHSRDLELGNLSVNMLRSWARKWGKQRLSQNVRLAAALRPHFPIHLILLEIWGGILGWSAYRRSVERVRVSAITHHRARVANTTPLSSRISFGGMKIQQSSPQDRLKLLIGKASA